MDFSYRLRVRYPECDAQGIVFNARYGDWTDIATTEFLRVLLQDPAGGVPFDYRLITQTKTWKKPAHFDDVVECLVAVKTIGNSSFVVDTRMYRWRADAGVLAYTEKELLTQIETTYVQVDPRQGTKLALTEATKTLLTTGAPNQCVDHAGVGSGRIVRRISRNDWVTMPWKNGGGITHELLRQGTGAQGWALRLSLAEVSMSGPFSVFDGIDRTIMLVQGKGFMLTRKPDGLQVTIDQPASPFAFLGEDRWDCMLIDGPVLDFNVMRDRARPGGVRVCAPGWVRGRYFLCLEEGKVGEQAVSHLELLELAGPLKSAVNGVEIDF